MESFLEVSWKFILRKTDIRQLENEAELIGFELSVQKKSNKKFIYRSRNACSKWPKTKVITIVMKSGVDLIMTILCS